LPTSLRGWYPSWVPPALSFHVVGVSHHTASVEVRERFAFTAAELGAWLEQHHRAGLSGLLLSTCNRCELYWWGDHDLEPRFREFAGSRGEVAPEALTRFEGEAAVRHLFTVAAGLDSQILGETEILGQVRRAFDAARAAGTTTRQMDSIFSAALSTGRRIRRETPLGRHPASVSSAAVDLAASRWGGLAGRRVVVLGAGEVGEGVLRALHQRGAASVKLVNRHPARARVLAAAWDAEVGGLEDLDALLSSADLFLVSTSAARPVVSAARLAAACATRNGSELVVMDLAVPRNVEPAARSIPGIALFDLDDLQRLCCPAAGAASAALADAERVLTEELGRLELALNGRAAAPRLAELHRLGEQVAQQEAAWALAQLAHLSDREREVVREMADRLVRRVLYPVSRSIRQEERAKSSLPHPDAAG
jgi:glutamyl-tRNA reductase